MIQKECKGTKLPLKNDHTLKNKSLYILLLLILPWKCDCFPTQQQILEIYICHCPESAKNAWVVSIPLRRKYSSVGLCTTLVNYTPKCISHSLTTPILLCISYTYPWNLSNRMLSNTYCIPQYIPVSTLIFYIWALVSVCRLVHPVLYHSTTKC